MAAGLPLWLGTLAAAVLAALTALHRALAEGKFRLQYQPLVRLDAARPVGRAPARPPRSWNAPHRVSGRLESVLR